MGGASFATLTSKGQITIPKEVRDALHLRPGDRIVFKQRNGSVVIESALAALERTFASVEPKQRPENFAALRDEVMDWIADRGERPDPE